jgi:glyoxylase-like metal-dependent hydrolase (beta-lactamase superfamily II)
MLTLRTFPVLIIATVLSACGKDPVPPSESPAESAAATATASGNVHEFTIGELTAYALKDGDFVLPNDGKIFALNRSPEDVAKLLEQANVSTTELTLSIQPLLVKSGDRVLLFDTGAGTTAGEAAGKLLASLNEAGIEPASVTDIFISHAHGDHIGGAFDKDGALVFPNATVRMSAAEWAATEASAANDEQRASLVQTIAPKVETFAPGVELIEGVVKAVDIKGHTPGHSGYLITSGDESLLYIGDSAHHYIVSVQEPDWTIQFDGDAPTAQTSRKELLQTNADSGQRIYAVHFPFPGLGKFSREGERFVWSAEDKLSE